VRKLLDPACGTGGMLAEAQNYLREHHGAAQALRLWPGLQQAGLRHRGIRHADEAGGPQRLAGNNVRFGDSFTEDQFAGETFDYFLTNPPFGVDWKKQQKEIKQERDRRGFDGASAPGCRA
jgi:type I restriction enzyme M protein